MIHDDHQAVYWYRKAAEQGFAVAQTNLGIMYVLGQGVEANEIEAMKWFSNAATGGANRALVNQAILYMQGAQIPRDYAAAQKLLSQALASGVEEAAPLLKRCQEYQALGQGAASAAATTAQANPH